jgi:hypothetical protein
MRAARRLVEFAVALRRIVGATPGPASADAEDAAQDDVKERDAISSMVCSPKRTWQAGWKTCLFILRVGDQPFPIRATRFRSVI